MDFINPIVQQIPDTAKDVRLNLDAVLSRSSLAPEDALGVALAAAFAARCPQLVQAVKSGTPQAEANAALTAAALMGMNNVWYPFIEMAGDEELKTMRPELRMNAYATHGGVSKAKFEAYALAASIVGKCHFCVKSHYELLKKEGWTTQQLRDVGRIAAVVNATAQVLSAQG
jgi:lipoyl-dependent peroxiredoxin subunit D